MTKKLRAGLHPQRGAQAFPQEKGQARQRHAHGGQAGLARQLLAADARAAQEGEVALEVEDGKIVAIYVVRNPDKLRHLEGDATQRMIK